MPYNIKKYEGKLGDYVFGRNSHLTEAIPEEVVQNSTGEGDAFVFCYTPGGFTVQVSSGSAQDSIDESGAQKVRLHGLDSSGNLKDLTISMTGKTAVDAGTWSFLYNAKVVQVGSFGTNAGQIRCAIDDGSDMAVISSDTAEGISMSAQYKVPTNFSATVTRVWASLGPPDSPDATGTVRLVVGASKTSSLRTVFSHRLNEPSKRLEHFLIPGLLNFPAGSLIQLRALYVDGSILTVHGGFDILLTPEN